MTTNPIKLKYRGHLIDWKIMFSNKTCEDICMYFYHLCWSVRNFLMKTGCSLKTPWGGTYYLHPWGCPPWRSIGLMGMDKILNGGIHDDVMSWKPFPHYKPIADDNHCWQVVSPHKGLVMRSFKISLNCGINSKVAVKLRHHDAHVIAL